MSSDPAPAMPTIHEAERAPGTPGAVYYGADIDRAAAVARRRADQDVVVRGPDKDANRRLAAAIATEVGPAERQDPHQRAGPAALPHFQQQHPPPQGHTFYETARRRARKQL